MMDLKRLNEIENTHQELVHSLGLKQTPIDSSNPDSQIISRDDQSLDRFNKINDLTSFQNQNNEYPIYKDAYYP